MGRGLREVGIFAVTIYLTFIAAAVVLVLGFGFHDVVLGGRPGGVVLWMFLFTPTAVVAILGYAVGAYLRQHKRGPVSVRYKHVALGGILCGVLAPPLMLAPMALQFDASAYLFLAGVLVLVLGAITGWLIATHAESGEHAA
jgi:hypothetical protein